MYQKLLTFIDLEWLSLRNILANKLVKINTYGYIDYLPLLRLSQCKNYNMVAYHTAIAFPVAKKIGSTPRAVAENLVNLWTQSLPELEIIILESGIIEFQVKNINPWLEFLAEKLSFPIVEIQFNPEENNEIFFLKFTMKRCLSLLHLAQEEKLINLDNWNNIHGMIISEYEQKLVNEFVTITDSLSGGITTKLVQRFALVFWEFERYCRIFGEVKQTNKPLAQGRLYLVYLTYLLLDKCIDYSVLK
jgi:arginyl-tRNA synthetase